MSRDYYELLGRRTASADDIKKAFRKLAMQHHPDRNNPGKDAEQKRQPAYDILKDRRNARPVRPLRSRRLRRRRRADPGAVPGASGFDFGSVFGDVFEGDVHWRSRTAGNRGDQRGQDPIFA